MKLKSIFRVFMLIAFLGGLGWTLYYLYNKEQDVPVVYEDAKANYQDVEIVTVATGSVVPRKEILIKPVVSGIINKLYVEAGDMVRKGDVIAQVKIIPEMVSLNNAKSRLSIAKTQLNNAEIDKKRYEQLFESNVISASELQQYSLAYKNAMIEYEAAEDNLSIIEDGIAKDSGAETNTLVKSTITGMILDVPIKEGNQVIEANTFNEGTTIASVADMNDMIFEGDLDESEVGKVQLGMPIEVTIGAMQNFSFNANLEHIAPKGEDKNGAIQFKIKAAVHVPDSVFIRAGYSANAKIVLQNSNNVLTVNEGLITYENNDAFIYVKEANGYTKTAVELGLSDGINTEIVSGIDSTMVLRGRLKM